MCVCVCEGTVLAGRLPAGVGWEDEREPRRAHSRWACSVRVWQPCLPLPPQAYLRGGCLLVCALEQIVGYLGLAYYLDSVLPDSYGVCRPPWFLLQPGYWSRQKVRRPRQQRRRAARLPTARLPTTACTKAAHVLAQTAHDVHAAIPPDTHGGACPPSRSVQKHSVRSAARALAAPTELQEGVVVDPDVQQETDTMRMLCQQHISQ